ncbi:hypothetical protein HanXRQr2_Chr06g0274121 [Helianthus annuus]|uniref:Uncharacterized protein n=1 Tax=Helianthus annuus TaxID=4232 RepID=A0A9K3IV60_HELAN|nr:hypothetical protein HanXRQr2_Chr06g0274121 [Helianthus annuus]KAJ0916696.1 hypothetical protein HanPSC8_Chr06g0264771 [Helianthus annuus]
MISSLEYNLEFETNTTKVQLTKIESTSRLAKNGKIENTRCHSLPYFKRFRPRNLRGNL